MGPSGTCRTVLVPCCRSCWRNKSAVLPLRLVISKPASYTEVKLKAKPDTVDFNHLSPRLCDLNVN